MLRSSFQSKLFKWVTTLTKHCFTQPSIAQLVERRTVDSVTGILRSLVQLRLEGSVLIALNQLTHRQSSLLNIAWNLIRSVRHSCFIIRERIPTTTSTKILEMKQTKVQWQKPQHFYLAQYSWVCYTTYEDVNPWVLPLEQLRSAERSAPREAFWRMRASIPLPLAC